MPLSIDLTVEHDAWTDHWPRPGELDALARRAVDAAFADLCRRADAPPPDGAELSIVFCDDAFIQILNKRWRGKDQPTNVLSFPAAEAARAFMFGDIVVAYQTTKREAEERGTPLADYLTHLIVHGLLHLLGFDHDTTAEAKRMEALESRVLAQLGVASPYEDTGLLDRRISTELEDAADLRATP